MRVHLVRGLGLALLIALGLWLAASTEWVEVDRFKPATGEAARNRFYATQQLARRLGARVTQATQLDPLPPADAALVLTSWDWDLFPGRAQALRRWVEQGGHLVLYADSLENEALGDWVPVDRLESRQRGRAKATEPPLPDAEAASADSAPPPPPNAKARPSMKRGCTMVSEHSSTSSRPTPFEICTLGNWASAFLLRSGPPATWSLDGPAGPVMLRVALGAGDVTVVGPDGFFDSQNLLRTRDNAVAAALALQLRQGGVLWFVAEEARPHLVRWLWSRAWIVLVLALLAFALAIWRGAARFGPVVAAPPRGRRSMAEQITGTARFLRREDPPALHRAQVRALDQAATARLHGYARMDRRSRAQALAGATGLDAEALVSALQPLRTHPAAGHAARDPVSVLELLETARRLLVQSAGPGPAQPPRA